MSMQDPDLALLAKEIARLLEPVLREKLARPLPEYLTLAEVASATSFSYDFVYDAVRSGDLPAIKKRGQWRVAVADMRAWMDRDRGGVATPSRSEGADLIRRHLPGLAA